MNGQTEQLQLLIGEIDGVLSKVAPSLPWVMAGGTAEQRQLLERVRSYLMTLQQNQGASTPTNLLGSPFSQTEQGAHYTSSPDALQQQVSQQILQAVMQELGYLRAGLTQPIQADVERLQQQRAALLEEIKQLELRRQYYLQTQVSPMLPTEAIHTLVAQLQAVLAQSTAAMPLPSASTPYGQVLSGEMVGNADSSMSAYAPQQLQALQAQSDRLLMNLDTTLRMVCDSLQRNLQTYEESLSQGLEKMHSLGQQGEMMFTAWMNFLVQRLGQESAAYLQTSYPLPNLEPASATRSDDPRSLAQAPLASALTPQTQRVLDQLGIKPPVIDLPYPGTELPTASTDPLSLNNSRFNLEDMDLEDLDLSDLNFSPPLSPTSQTLDDFDDVTDRQDLSEPLDTPGLEVPELEWSGIDDAQVVDDATEAVVADDENLNSALEFLEQLSAALQDQTSESVETLESDAEESDALLSTIADEPLTSETLTSTELLASLDHLPSEPSIAQVKPADAIASKFADLPSLRKQGDSETSYQELDEFYNSLFGSGNVPPALDFEAEEDDRADTAPYVEANLNVMDSEIISSDTTSSDINLLDGDLSGLSGLSGLFDGINADNASLDVDQGLLDLDSVALDFGSTSDIDSGGAYLNVEAGHDDLSGEDLGGEDLGGEDLSNDNLRSEDLGSASLNAEWIASDLDMLGLDSLGEVDSDRTDISPGISPGVVSDVTGLDAGDALDVDDAIGGDSSIASLEATEAVVDLLMAAPSLLQQDDVNTDETVIEPEIIDASVSLLSDDRLTLESPDLFPGVELFSQEFEPEQFGLEQFGFDQFRLEREEPDHQDPVQDNVDDASDVQTLGLGIGPASESDENVDLDDRPLLTLDDLFQAEDSEPPPTRSLPQPIVSVAQVAPEMVATPTNLDASPMGASPMGAFPVGASPVMPSIDSADGDDLASLEEFLGSSPLSLPSSLPSIERQPMPSITTPEMSMPLPPQASASEPNPNILDDDYIPASPDETLLVSQSVVDGDDAAPQDVDFWLNASVLRQLSDDLSSLEYAQPTDDAWEGLTFDDPAFTNAQADATAGQPVMPETPATIVEPPSIVPPASPSSSTDVLNPNRLETLFGALVTPADPAATDALAAGQDVLTPDSLEEMFAEVPSVTDDVPLSLPYSVADSLGNAVAMPDSGTTAASEPLVIDLPPDDLTPNPVNLPPTGSDTQSGGITLNDMFADFSDVEDSQKKKIDPSFLISRARPDTATVPAIVPPVLEPAPRLAEPAIAPTANTVLQTNTVLQPPDRGTVADDDSHGGWYLGLDIGTTGISGVLFNRSAGKLYPIGWQTSDFPEVSQSSRLPAIAYIPNLAESVPQAVGSHANALQAFMQDAYATDRAGVLIQHFKPYLKVALPYTSTVDASQQPMLRWSTQCEVPLIKIQQTLQALLTTLVENQSSQISALGLDTPALRKAMANLSGVILGYPHNWSDTYSVNLRDIVLRTGLVQHPDQVIFIEETIAAVLSGLPAARDALKTVSKRHRHQKETNWRGSTLVINSGATTTELSVVFLPDQVQELAHDDFSIRSLAYAGNALDQDIISRVIYPAWIEQQTLTIAQAQVREQAVPGDLLPDFTIPNPDGSWEALGFTAADLPTPGDPDLARRQALQQQLEHSTLGKLLLEAARYIKLALQHRNSVSVAIGNKTCVIQRRQLESEVFLPFVKRLNEGLKELLEQTGFIPQTINQVICTGGTASLPAIARWLRQKLPNATIIQDTYAPDQVLPHLLPAGVAHFTPIAPLCSRVAYGLAMLPLYPNVMDLPRQQYGDYFLLSELLRLVADAELFGTATLSPTLTMSPTFSLNEIMQRLASRAVDTHACQHRIMALLEGHLPPGLIPSPNDWALFSSKSLRYPACQQLLAAPLFTQHYDPAGGQVYRADINQCRIIREFLETVAIDSRQTLERPLVITLGVIDT